MGLQKHRNLWAYAFGNLFVYKTRTLTVLLCFVVVIGALCSIEFLREGITQDIEASMAFVPDITVQRLQGGRQVPLTETDLQQIWGITGVATAAPRVWGFLTAANLLFTMMGINVTEYPLDVQVLNLQVRAGRFLQPNDTQCVVVGEGVAQSAQATVGSYFLFYDLDLNEYYFEVVGIFSASSRIYSSDLILTDLESARAFFGLNTTQCTDICVWTALTANPAVVASQILTAVASCRVVTRAQSENALLYAHSSRAGFFLAVWYVLLLAALLGAFSVSSAVSSEARREVGLLKALGFDTLDILEIRLAESTMLGFLAATLGVFAGVVYDFYLGAPFLANFMLGWSQLFPLFTVPASISWVSVFTAYAMAIVPLLIATVLPAWRSAIAEPDEVLRGL